MNFIPRKCLSALLCAASLAVCALGSGCVVRENAPPPEGAVYVDPGPAQVDVVDDYGYHHRGYYDQYHYWHGGYYDRDHRWHDDDRHWHH